MNTAATQSSESGHTPSPSRTSRWSHAWSTIQLVLSLAVTLGVLVYLLFSPASSLSTLDQAARAAAPDIVQIVGPRSCVQPGSPLDQKIQVVPVRKHHRRSCWSLAVSWPA